jgi:hypothetical protein
LHANRRLLAAEVFHFHVVGNDKARKGFQHLFFDPRINIQKKSRVQGVHAQVCNDTTLFG